MSNRNRIPTRQDGTRDLSRLDSHERVVLAALYRQPRAAEDVARAAGLSLGQTASALKRLMSPQRCGPLGCVAVARDDVGVYSVTEQWRATHRTEAPRAVAA